MKEMKKNETQKLVSSEKSGRSPFTILPVLKFQSYESLN